MKLDDPTAQAFLDGIPEQTVEDVVEALKEGATTPAEALGFDETALNGIERIGLGYYHARRYEKAATIFGFVLQMNPERASTWRALGACAHSSRNYGVAAICYTSAVTYDPTDLISMVLLGEILCMHDETEQGLRLLEEAVGQDNKRPEYHAYILRAKSILAAQGGIPPAVIIRQKGRDYVKAARQELAKELGIDDTEDPEFRFAPDEDLTWKEAQKHPELKKAIENVGELLNSGRITYKDVAGFTDEQMDGAYKIAAGYVQQEKFAEAIHFVGMMLFLDPNSARFHKLQGICMQRMKQLDGAEFHYSMALQFEPDDWECMVYRGEAIIQNGNVDEGLGHVRAGLEGAQKAANQKNVVRRAQVLLKQFG